MGKSQRFHNTFQHLKKISFLYSFFGFFLAFSLALSIKIFEIILFSLLVLIFAYKGFKKGKSFILSFLIFFLLASILGILLRFLPTNFHEEKQILVLIIESKEKYAIGVSFGKRYLINYEDKILEEGDILRIKGKILPLSIPHYEGRFSFEEYLANQGVKAKFDILEANFLFTRPLRLREKEISFLASFNSETASLLDALLFNVKNYDSEILKGAKAIGVINFLSVSGFYFSFYKRFLIYLWGLKFPQKKAYLLTTLFLLPLLPFSIRKIGIFRSFLSLSLDTIFLLKNRKPLLSLTKNSFFAFLFLLINHYLVKNVSFLASFGTSFYFFFIKRRLKEKKNNFQKKIWGFLSLLFFFLPFFIIDSKLHLFSPFISFLLLPFSFSLQIIGYFGYFFIPNKFLINNISNFISNSFLPFINKCDLTIPIFGKILPDPIFYFSSLFFLLYLDDYRLIYFEKKFVIIEITGIIFSLLPFQNLLSYEVTFIDVGQGDSILISSKGKNVLIDTGGTLSFDIGKEVLIPFFYKKNIHYLDALIITHDDFDHMGAKDTLIKQFNVGKVLDSKEAFPITFGPISLKNWNSFAPTKDNKNRNSLVLSVSLGSRSFLFMGDATKEVEQKMLENDVGHFDILKAGHHGSNSSSSYEFLKRVCPNEIVFSSGKGNRYGHPDKEVLNRCKSLNITIRRTDLEGSIVYKGFC